MIECVAKEIPVKGPDGQELAMIVDDEDYELLSRLTWYTYRDKSSGQLRPMGRAYPHRLVMDAPLLVDHVNRDPMDNRKTNLRPASFAQNTWNRGLDRRNTTGYKGVHKPSGRNKEVYRAKIHVNGKYIYLGSFDNPVDAAKAYDAAAREYYGKFAWLNFPEEEVA